MDLTLIWNDAELIKTLQKGGVVVMPTDTLYGIVGRAQDASVVNRIYALRKRNPEKPCIVLIGEVSEIEKFSILLSSEQKNALKEFWFTPPQEGGGAREASRAVSIIFKCLNDTFEYLHRGTKSLAFRLPESQALRDLLLKTGPLVAPSANPEGLPYSKNIEEAQNYFGNEVDLYVNGGEISGQPSKVIRLEENGTTTVLRA